MKTITTILTACIILVMSNTVAAQVNSPQNPNVRQDRPDTSTIFTPIDSTKGTQDPGPIVSPPVPNTPGDDVPSTAPNTKPKPPGTPHPGTTVDPRLNNETSFKFDQNDFLKSVGKTGTCDGSSCAVVVSNDK